MKVRQVTRYPYILRFVGLVVELNSEDGESSRIAVKTLRKSATEVSVAQSLSFTTISAAQLEKCEFLAEAKLMWNCKHEHILTLRAICLDNDPNFLILELMEGGDLLSYLRANRPSPSQVTQQGNRAICD